LYSALKEGIEAGPLRLHSLQSGEIRRNKEAVPHAEANYHQSHQSCRDACDSPQYVYSWLKRAKKLAIGDERVSDSDGGVPKLYDTDGHVEAEKVEGALVAVADAGLGPHAVMV
jgi:hypothetical protein